MSHGCMTATLLACLYSLHGTTSTHKVPFKSRKAHEKYFARKDILKLALTSNGMPLIPYDQDYNMCVVPEL
ncbi:hypothetical protein BDR05DRAFT_958389 [Suillus weaverae]|nr:hypothetical protein BDR05DRAFT_958389 [Suillus weaverae]